MNEIKYTRPTKEELKDYILGLEKSLKEYEVPEDKKKIIYLKLSDTPVWLYVELRYTYPPRRLRFIGNVKEKEEFDKKLKDYYGRK